jgi:hypothetical protein
MKNSAVLKSKVYLKFFLSYCKMVVILHVQQVWQATCKCFKNLQGVFNNLWKIVCRVLATLCKWLID